MWGQDIPEGGHGHHGHHQGHHHEQNNTQTWQPMQGQYYRFISALSNQMVLDVSQNQHDLNHLIIYEWNGGLNQKFYFQPAGGNRYAIFNAKTNGAMQVV
jgi:hypothetical protein